MTQKLYYEDLEPGRCFESRVHELTEEELIGFARQYDPQFFHTDPEAARDSVFNGLAASGWHTCALSMRLITDSPLGRVANGLVGMQIDSLHWPVPTRAGDTLRVEVEVLERRVSSSQPKFGVVRLRWTTRNQRNEIAMQLENAIWAARRPQVG